MMPQMAAAGQAVISSSPIATSVRRNRDWRRLSLAGLDTGSSAGIVPSTGATGGSLHLGGTSRRRLDARPRRHRTDAAGH